jgi:hypothetical protein
MHYLALSNGFGRFDQDNLYRWEMAGYLNWTNAIVGDLEAHGDARRVRGLLTAADWAATAAVQSFKRWNYLAAAASARLAYTLAAAAAGSIGAPTPTLDAARRPLPEARRVTDGCYIREPLR